MTPRGQAHKLIVSFYYKLPNNGGQNGIASIPARWKEGIKCADLFIMMMLEEYELTNNQNTERVKYWIEVQKELEKFR